MTKAKHSGESSIKMGYEHLDYCATENGAIVDKGQPSFGSGIPLSWPYSHGSSIRRARRVGKIIGAFSKFNSSYNSAEWRWPVFEGILIETVYLSTYLSMAVTSWPTEEINPRPIELRRTSMQAV